MDLAARSAVVVAVVTAMTVLALVTTIAVLVVLVTSVLGPLWTAVGAVKVPADGASVSVPAEAVCVYNTLVAAVPVLAELDTDALFRDNGGYVFLKLGLRVLSDGKYGIGNRSCDSLWLFSVQTSTTNAKCQGLE